MVSLGNFSFDVDIETSKAVAALNALERQAAATNAVMTRLLGGASITVNTSAAQQNIGSLTAAAQTARTAIERPITPKVDTAPAQSALQKFSASVSQGLGIGGGAAIAVAGIQALKGAIEGSIGAGLAYNAQLETATRTFELFTGSAGKAQDALKTLRTYADFTPFDTAEVIRGGQAFIQATNGDIAAMEKLVHLAGQLAATNNDPSAGGGFEGAVRALREVLGGQTESIADRFNIPRSTIQSLKDAGLSGIELAEALVKAGHGSEELVKALSETSTGQLSNFQSALANLGKTATEPLFKELTASVKDLNGVLSGNQSGWDGWGKSVGDAIAYPVREIRLLAEGLAFVGAHLPGTGITPQAGTGQLGLFGPTSGSSSRRPSTSAPAPGSVVNTGPSDAAPVVASASARSAEQLKADAEKLGKELKELDDDRTRHALQALSDQVEAERRASAAKKDLIEADRDAAVKAADRTRDAAVAALDAEAQARDRARTLEDRSRAAAQEAELRGLESAHNANLKGLDEQAAAIQKRHDEEIKGIEAEIRAVDRKRDEAIRGIDEEARAVDRKRDAAVKAIDEELRAESRRHAEAVRNIDIERDRRLGIIDEQLKALDAAAQRDQRRQTDQSLQRTLSDAQRDRKQADTPEERLRADRAVADAKAAIAREETNRRREDARDRLRDQADQIREAAETAKAIEAARNQTTTDTLGTKKTGITDAAKAATERLAEQKRVLDDQANADTERLQAVKARVDEETKIEADSIKTRIDAENEGYRQAAQAAQDSFKEIQRAVDDQRTNEDAALDVRRKAVQATYDGAVESARTAATEQIKELERQTQSTTDNLDAQKRKWTEWKEHILGEIDAAMKTGDPDKLKHLQTSPDDSTFGPLDPPGYRQDSTYGPFDPDGYRDAAKAVGTSTADGLATGIGSPESIAAATGATDKLIQDGVIDRAKELLGIASPSTVFAGFGTDTAQGFLDGYQTLDLATPIRAPFEESIRWIGGLPDAFRANGDATAAAWKEGYDQYDLYAIGRFPFEELRDWLDPGFENLMTADGTNAGAAWQAGYATKDLFAIGRLPFERLRDWITPGFENLMRNAGAADAAAFGTGWTSRNPGQMIQNSLTTIVQNANSLTSSWAIVGQNFAVGLSNGFNAYLDANPLQVPDGGGGYSGSSGGTTASATSSATAAATSSGGSTLRAGQYDVENYLLKYGLVPGTADFNNYFDYYFAEQAKGHSMPADMVITGHALGGFAPANRMAMFGEGGMEFGLPPQAGSILPADVSRNLLAVASGQAVGSGAAGGASGDISINIDLGGVTVKHEADEQRLATTIGERMREELSQALGQGQRFPYGISRTP